MGMPLSTFFKERTDGLTLFFSTMVMVLLVTPAFFTSSLGEIVHGSHSF